jgi:NADPH:quinone reductase-like Zn-dependent oxidoreductase
MQAIICEGFGSADVLKVGQRELPVVGEGEVLIKV